MSNADLKLFPGMTANVKIVTGKAEHALRLPVAALRFHPAAATRPGWCAKGKSKSGKRAASGAQAQQAVYVLDQGKLKRVPVKLGLTDGNYTEILSGLTEGQTVVTGTATTGKAAAPAATQASSRFAPAGFLRVLGGAPCPTSFASRI